MKPIFKSFLNFLNQGSIVENLNLKFRNFGTEKTPFPVLMINEITYPEFLILLYIYFRFATRPLDLL